MEHDDIQNYSLLCPCQSGELYINCCKPYMVKFYPADIIPGNDSEFTDWFNRYSDPIYNAFMKKASRYLFRISKYFDSYFSRYISLGYLDENDKDKNLSVFSMKNNILFMLFGSISCLSQYLFIPSGVLLRTVCEDCMVLIDLFENQDQMELLMNNKYSAKKLITRVKNFLPSCVIQWYGFFSANFTHPAEIRTAPIVPNACYSDNWMLITGIQNIVRAVVTYNIALERIYYNYDEKHLFWIKDNKGDLVFNEDSEVFDWSKMLGEELVKNFPPDERKDGYLYSEKTYKLKK